MPLDINAIIKIVGVTSDKDLSGQIAKALNTQDQKKPLQVLKQSLGGNFDQSLSGVVRKIERVVNAGGDASGSLQKIGKVLGSLGTIGNQQITPLIRLTDRLNKTFAAIGESDGPKLQRLEGRVERIKKLFSSALLQEAKVRNAPIQKDEADLKANAIVGQVGANFASRQIEKQTAKTKELKKTQDFLNQSQNRTALSKAREAERTASFLNKSQGNTALQKAREEEKSRKFVEASPGKTALVRYKKEQKEIQAAAAETAKSQKFVQSSPAKTAYYKYKQEEAALTARTKALEAGRKASQSYGDFVERAQRQNDLFVKSVEAAGEAEVRAAEKRAKTRSERKRVSDTKATTAQALKDAADLAAAQKQADASRAKAVREQGAEGKRDAAAAAKYIRDRNKYENETTATLRKQKSELRDLILLYNKASSLADSAGRNANRGNLKDLDAAIDAKTKAISNYQNGRARGPSGGGPPPPPPDDFTKGAVRATKEANKLNQAIIANRFSLENLGKAATLAFRRYSAFLIGTSLIYSVIGSIRRASNDFLEFEAQITKLEQVSTVTAKEIGTITTQILNLATQTGVAGTEIAKATQTLAQAGFGKSSADLQKFNAAIAKVPLAATFGSIEETTDGLLAIFGQFNKELSDTANILDLVNQFAADFAIESKDIFEIVKRGGSAFATAGGSFRELVELSSVLRSSTRESAETIGTFFKTSIAQLLSPRSQKDLRLLGVTADGVVDQLTQLSGIISNGNFSEIQKIQIAENLTGERQFARLLALLREIGDPKIQSDLAKTRDAVAGSLDRSIQKRLDDVGVSLNRIRQSTNELFTSFINNEGVKAFVSGLADIIAQANKLVTALKPLAPLLLAVGGVFAGRAVGAIGKQVVNKTGIGAAVGGFAGNISNILEPRKIGKAFQGVSGPLPPNAFIGPTVGQKLTSSIGRGIREFAGPGLGFGLPLVGSVIGGSLAQSTNPRTAKIGKGVSDIAGFAGAGAALGSVIPGIGTLGGAGIGAVAGIVKTISDSVDEQNRILLEAKVAAAKTSSEKIGAVTSSDISPGFIRSVLTGGNAITAKIAGDFIRAITQGSALAGIGGSIGETIAPRQSSAISNRLEGLSNLDKDTGQLVFEESLFKQVQAIQEELFKATDLTSLDLGNNEVLKTVEKGLNQQLIVAVTRFLADAAGISQSANPEEFAKLFDEVTGSFSKKLVDGIDAADITGRVSKRIKDFFNGLSFKDQLTSIKSSFRKVSDSLTEVFKGLGSQSDALASILTDANAGFKIKLPSSNRDLFKARGLDPLADFEDGIDKLAKGLSSALNNKGIFDTVEKIAELNKDIKDTDEASGRRSLETTLNQLLTEVDKSGIGKEFQAQVQFLAEASGRSIQDVLKDLDKLGGGSVRDFVAELVGSQGIAQALEKVAEAARKDAELFNQRLEIENGLKASIRSLGQASFEADQNISGFAKTLRDRLTEQLDFINEVGSVQSQTNSGRTAAGDASQRQFGGTPQFIQQLISAANDRNSQNTAAQDSGGSKTAAQGANNALNTFLDLQQSLGQRLSELDNKVSDASRASDSLRGAFTTLRDQIKGAGQAVTQFTVKGLADGISALREFRKNGLESLGDTQFTDLQKLLSSVGDFDLGGGVSGSKILGDINQQLGSTFLAAIRSEFTGETLDESQAAIAAQVEGLRSEQAAAAALEQTLRNEQLTLLKAQAQLIPIEQQFYQEQLSRLNQINLSLDPLKDIAAAVTKLTPPIPVIIGTTSGNASNQSQSAGSSTPQSAKSLFELGNNGPRNGVFYTPEEAWFKTTLQLFEKLVKNSEPSKSNPTKGILLNPTNAPKTSLPVDRFVPNPRLTKPTSPSPTAPAIDPFTPPLRFGPAPAFTDPNGRPTLTRPTDPRFQRPEQEPLFRREFQNPFKKNGDDTIFVKSVDSLNVGFEKAVKSLEKYNGTLEKLISGEARESVVRTQLDISPIQVNVAISAPDVLKLAGNSVYNAIIQAVAPAIASALGVVGPEVRNNFEANLPKALV